MASNVNNAKKVRQIPYETIQFLRAVVNFNDVGIANGIGLDTWLPAGSEILYTKVRIVTTFSQAGLTVGQNASSYNDIVSSSDVDPTAVGGTLAFRGLDLNLTADTQIFYKYTGTATQGKAVIVVAFVPDFTQQ